LREQRTHYKTKNPVTMWRGFTQLTKKLGLLVLFNYRICQSHVTIIFVTIATFQ
jgi:hypothetical protein